MSSALRLDRAASQHPPECAWSRWDRDAVGVDDRRMAGAYLADPALLAHVALDPSTAVAD